jgi:sarcosine oxidase subunit alpha
MTRAPAPAVAHALLRFDPVMRSPVHRHHQRLRGVLARVGGWEVPLRYEHGEDEGRAMERRAGVADITARGKVDVRGAVARATGRLLDGASLRPGRSVLFQADGHRGLVLAVSEVWSLVLCPPHSLPRVMASLEEVRPGTGTVMVTDVSSLYAGFAVVGPCALPLLSRLTALDLSALAPGRCAACRVAEVPAVLLRRELPVTAVEAYVGSEYGRYVWEALLEVGADLGAVPVGWEALETTGWW